MDLYRYFHPHHNPRLRKHPLRLQELGELQLAACELHKAIERAEIRSANSPLSPITEEHFAELARAMEYVTDTLGILTNAHPGDDLPTMKELMQEREEAPGWESWVRLLKQRLELVTQYD
jgi:hypothetical protein